MKYVFFLVLVLAGCGAKEKLQNDPITAPEPVEKSDNNESTPEPTIASVDVPKEATPEEEAALPEMIPVIINYKMGGDYTVISASENCGLHTEIKSEVIEVEKAVWLKSNTNLTCIKSFEGSGYVCDYTKMLTESNRVKFGQYSPARYNWRQVKIDPETLKESFAIPSPCG